MSKNDEYRGEDDAVTSERARAYSNQQSPQRRILLLLAVVMTFLFLYKFLTLLASKNKTAASLPPPAPVSTLNTDDVVVANNAKKIPEFSQKDKEIQEKMNNIERNMEQLREDAKQSAHQMQALNETLQQLQAHSMQQEAQLKQQQEAWMKAQQEKTAPVKKNVKVEQVVSAPTYMVRALIANRAWLETPGGSVITVTLGDEIKGHGTVTEIDVTNGEVRTSSFSVFSFPHDVH